ncbi:MAG: rubrerythrin [Clostridia bacterium]|nr:rubrerythrin [Clostridia bacterium]
MNHKHNLRIMPRDRLMHAWETSMGLVRDFERYQQEIAEDKEAAALFAKMAEDECVHASDLLALLQKREEA